MKSLDQALSEGLQPNPVEAAFLRQGYRLQERAPYGGVIAVSRAFPKANTPSESEIEDVMGFVNEAREIISRSLVHRAYDETMVRKYFKALENPATGLQARLALEGSMPGAEQPTFEPAELEENAHWLLTLPKVNFTANNDEGNKYVIMRLDGTSWSVSFGDRERQSFAGVASQASNAYWAPTIQK